MKNQLFMTMVLFAIVVAGCSNNTNSNNQVQPVSNKIELAGSDTMSQMVSNIAEAYSKIDPNTKISVTGTGSGAGIASLINGEIDIADASRTIKDKEMEQAKKNGITPTEFIIARDTLAVIVNKDNPLSKISIKQLSKIYQGNTSSWKSINGNEQQITLYGRQTTSGTYVYFQEEVVKGDYSPKMRNMEGNQAIIDAVRQDKSGIGYASAGYIVGENGKLLDGIKIVSIAKDEKSEYISPLDVSKRASYPLSRVLVQYFAKTPVKGTPIYNFLLFELSSEAQDIIKKSGYISIYPEDKAKNDITLSGLG